MPIASFFRYIARCHPSTENSGHIRRAITGGGQMAARPISVWPIVVRLIDGLCYVGPHAEEAIQAWPDGLSCRADPSPFSLTGQLRSIAWLDGRLPVCSRPALSSPTRAPARACGNARVRHTAQAHTHCRCRWRRPFACRPPRRRCPLPTSSLHTGAAPSSSSPLLSFGLPHSRGGGTATPPPPLLFSSWLPPFRAGPTTFSFLHASAASS